MEEKYRFLYLEEANKLSQNITISSTMNQSINNFLVIQTFITGACFYLSRYHLDYFCLSNAWYVFALILWSVSCLLNITILCFLIKHLFSVVYGLPLFEEAYFEKLTQFVKNGGNIDAIYKDWSEVYRRINFLVNFFREGKIRLFKIFKVLAIVSFLFLAISSLELGYYIHNNKEVESMSPEDKNNGEQNQEKANAPSQQETKDVGSTPAEQQKAKQQINPPSAKDQIVLITAGEKPDVKKAIETKNDVERENSENN